MLARFTSTSQQGAKRIVALLAARPRGAQEKSRTSSMRPFSADKCIGEQHLAGAGRRRR
jgi:hypothetical protein